MIPKSRVMGQLRMHTKVDVEKSMRSQPYTKKTIGN